VSAPPAGAPQPPDPIPYYGGSTPAFTPRYGENGPSSANVLITAFDYYPGGQGQPPVSVKPGQPVTFTNGDTAEGIYHTVTSCAAPCNLAYGQSYPLATWPDQTPGGFDSAELGYGPDLGPSFHATAASNQLSWTLTVPAGATNGTVFTYFCRIHPAMRGSLKVVN
jgi:plastocyanin